MVKVAINHETLAKEQLTQIITEINAQTKHLTNNININTNKTS